MKNIVEVIKENKGIILRRGLIIIGAVAGLTIVSKVLMGKSEESEDSASEEDTDTDGDDDCSEE